MTTEKAYHENGKCENSIGCYPSIEALVDELERANREFDRLWKTKCGNEAYDRAYEHLWSIRALINSTPAHTPDQFMAKMRAFKLTMALDKEFECHVLGSAREQAKSLIDEAAAIIASCGSGNQ